MGVFIDMVGKSFNRLTVIKRVSTDSIGNAVWECICVCGKTHRVSGVSLRQGRIQSCGCLSRENARRTKITQPVPLQQRFDKYALKRDGCWIWAGMRNALGYGVIRYSGKRSFAHRLSFELYKGQIPEGMYVCHKCDNPSCVNPDHLFIGSPKDNMDDMRAKGRENYVKGEQNSNAKLVQEQVIEIRNLYGSLSASKTAKLFSISKKSVLNIWNRHTWAHI